MKKSSRCEAVSSPVGHQAPALVLFLPWKVNDNKSARENSCCDAVRWTNFTRSSKESADHQRLKYVLTTSRFLETLLSTLTSLCF